MNYFNFKRYKFQTILKNFIFKRKFFLLVEKIPNILRDITKKLKKTFNIEKIFYAIINNFFTLVKDIFVASKKKLKFKYFNPINFNFVKKKNLINKKYIFIYTPTLLFLSALIFLSIPMFFNYTKVDLEKKICTENKIKCSIKGDIKYTFYPSPRIKIKDLKIKDYFEKNNLISAKEVLIKIPLKNLLYIDTQEAKKIVINNFVVNFNVKNIQKYKSLKNEKINFSNIKFKNGLIKFNDKKKKIAEIKNVTINVNLKKKANIIKLKGNFLNDTISLKYKKKEDLSTNIVFKMSDLNLLAELEFFNSPNKLTNGNLYLKRNKSKFTAFYEYNDQDKKILVLKSNLRNIFLDGKLTGVINFKPFFGFNLDLNLNSLNFTKLYTYFLSLNDEEQLKLFEVNNKFNGELNLSAEKIYSKYNLIKSLESRVKFRNNNILIEQLLLNLGKIGAADIVGGIYNDPKFVSLKFEKNIFVDNKKKLLSKFGIYNKKDISPSFYLSGNFDLRNKRMTFYEISGENKIKIDDVNFIENEFNDIMLDEKYINLFNFASFKEFLKSINSD